MSFLCFLFTALEKSLNIVCDLILDLIKRLIDNESMKKSVDKKDKIIETALELFAKRGFDGTSTRDICKLANVNISMISYYFGGKEGLYKFILQDLLNKQLEYINQFYNPDMFNNLSRKQKAEMFLSVLDKMVDFLYGQMSDKLMLFLIKEQRNIAKDFVPPVVPFLRGVLSSILEKDINSREIAFQGLFIASQISSPRFMKVLKFKTSI